MRFWLTLVLSTIGISAGLTWLSLHQGAQITPGNVKLTDTGELPGEFTFDPKSLDKIAQNVTVQDNVISIATRESAVHQENTLEIKFQNKGKGPLRFSLITASCGCSHAFLNGQELQKGEPGPDVAPNGEGTLKLVWKAQEKHFSEQEGDKGYRFAFEFYFNDTRFSDNLKIEVYSRIKNPFLRGSGS